MVSKISPESLDALLKSEEYYGVIDVREKPEYERGQIFGASLIPRRLLEYRVSQLFPVKDTRLVVYDDDGKRAQLAAKTLLKFGYTNIAYLEGGLNGWKDRGLFTVEGVNVPSKAFGELVASYEEVPQVDAEVVKEWLDNNENMVIFEVRPPEEVRKTGSIPSAINVPGMELTETIFDHIEAGKKIVTTCAGRTRGIMAVQILKLMGCETVYDLKNGIMGWVLAGFQLEKEIPKGPPPSISSKAQGEMTAQGIAQEVGIRYISINELKELQERAINDVLYKFDVRTLEEYLEGHIPGAIFLPGGQALQVTDEYIGVRKGKIVLICDNITRSTITAFWLKQMGFTEVFVLEGGVKAWVERGELLEQGVPEIIPLGLEEAKNRVKFLEPMELKGMLEERSIKIINVDDSGTYSNGHIPGSSWVSRSWLEIKIREAAPRLNDILVISSYDGINGIYAAATLEDMGYDNVFVLKGGIENWQNAGLPLETGLTGVEGEPDDVFYKPYERKTKVKEAMVRYLTWEENLLTRPEYKHYFRNYQPFKMGK